MGSDGAVNILYRNELAAATDMEDMRAKLVADYRRTFANPYRTASLGYIDEVILPRNTRPRIVSALGMLRNKRQENPRRKHGNIPL
jgi:propionyl-CoA carboxylase beta chain